MIRCAKQDLGTTRSVHRLLIAVLVLVLVPGCASTGGGSEEGSDRAVLTRAQLEPVEYLSAYDAIRRYRPVWLRTQRGQDSFSTQGRRGIRIYQDGVFIGGMPVLQNLQVREIEEIRFLDKRQATTRFGTDHSEGAILITTRST